MEFNKVYSVSGIITIDDNPVNITYKYDNDNPPNIIYLVVYQKDKMSLYMTYKDGVLNISNLEDNMFSDEYLQKIESYCVYLFNNFNKI